MPNPLMKREATAGEFRKEDGAYRSLQYRKNRHTAAKNPTLKYPDWALSTKRRLQSEMQKRNANKGKAYEKISTNRTAIVRFGK